MKLFCVIRERYNMTKVSLHITQVIKLENQEMNFFFSNQTRNETRVKDDVP